VALIISELKMLSAESRRRAVWMWIKGTQDNPAETQFYSAKVTRFSRSRTSAKRIRQILDFDFIDGTRSHRILRKAVVM
jgi:hypothetical protein